MHMLSPGIVSASVLVDFVIRNAIAKRVRTPEATSDSVSKPLKRI